MAKRKPKSILTTFDEYFLSSKVGEGATGKVYKAVDSSGNPFAIKLLNADQAAGARLRRFKNELMFCQRNKHPNILTVVDHGILMEAATRSPFYVMPLYDCSLRSLMSEGLTPDRAFSIFAQVLDGVDAAHKLGVIHRDLKPENILISQKDGTVVVADFGIAHFSEEALYTAVETGSNERLANFQYASPEQRARGGTVDPRSDIYSLGLLLNELFTGKLALGSSYVKIQSVAHDYGYLDEIVDLMIRQLPEDRPSSTDAVKHLLLARKAESIELQRVSDIKQTVVPASDLDDPLVLTPLQIVGFDWHKGVLTLLFSQAVTQGWLYALQNMGSFTSAVRKGPEAFIFSGNKATIGADESDVQTIIDYFKDWIPKATRVYENNLRREIAERQAKMKQTLLAEQAEREKRARILRNVKL
ncbi:MAG: serine/threonine protein kinase [Planctomycetes bacterium]|nr:serine/threonine protein kinase [Planctomycetota bacterium]